MPSPDYLSSKSATTQGKTLAHRGQTARLGWSVRAVIPCYNRQADLDLLLADLARLDLEAQTGSQTCPIHLSVHVVDNASEPPLHCPNTPFEIRRIRIESNAGGSGGFNAGLRAAIDAADGSNRNELLWLIDSDARVEPTTLRTLVEAMANRPDLAAAGSALVDPATNQIFELGGRVNPQTGEYEQFGPGDVSTSDITEVQYVAACSMIVRRDAAAKAGLMTDLFINGDDVEWCIRLAKQGAIAIVPKSIARHPCPDKMRSWDRYYAARNAFVPIAALGLGPKVRFKRAIREVARALCQTMVGRDDLARLHLQGLADAAAGLTIGPGPGGRPTIDPFRPIDQLSEALAGEGRAGLWARAAGQRAVIHAELDAAQPTRTNAIAQVRSLGMTVLTPGPQTRGIDLPTALGILRRIIVGPETDVAIVSARAWPRTWLTARTIATVCDGGFALRRVNRFERMAKAAMVCTQGGVLALRLARRGVAAPQLARPAVQIEAKKSDQETKTQSRPTLSIIVLSYNRKEALEQTLVELAASPTTRAAEIIVVDNGSKDGSAQAVASRFIDAQIEPLRENVGVEGFNIGVRRARGDAVLILDDDARPDPQGLNAALDLLASREDIGAVALHPRHPADGRSEWPFAAATGPTDSCPVMGCGNLVRKSAWEAVDGYEQAFFLYRNDTDLALKLLDAGLGVYFDPSWVVWHDSPAARRKSDRWFELATRNWFWMARRHGRGFTGLAGLALGWIWAHKLAGLNFRSHTRIIRGATKGLLTPAPPVPNGTQSDGKAFAKLIQQRLKH